MNQRTKRTLKAALRMFEFLLLVLLVMTMLELMLMYKDAHDHPENYVMDSPRRRAAAMTNAAPVAPAAQAQPPAMAPGAVAPGRRPLRNANRPRRPGAPNAQPGPAAAGGNGRPSVLSFTHVRNQVSVFFVSSPDHTAAGPDPMQPTNELPTELTMTNGAPEEAELSSNRGVGFLAPEFVRTPPPSRRGETNGEPAFRFAIP